MPIWLELPQGDAGLNSDVRLLLLAQRHRHQLRRRRLLHLHAAVRAVIQECMSRLDVPCEVHLLDLLFLGSGRQVNCKLIFH